MTMHTLLAPTPALAVTRTDRGLTIHTLDLDGLQPVGTFTSAADAWRAIDELDSPEGHAG
jgi:hypothetical protein